MSSIARPYEPKASRSPAFVRLGSRFEQALAYVVAMHREQARKDKPVPYLSHLLGVASIVLEFGGSEDQAIAGLLHDTIEDCGAEHVPEIRERFGEEVLLMVRACTDSEVPGGEDKSDWHERKRAYLLHLSKLDPRDPALLVSASDKLHNARAIVTDLRRDPSFLASFNGGTEGQLSYYETLSGIFEGLIPGALSDELRRTVEQMRPLASPVPPGVPSP